MTTELAQDTEARPLPERFAELEPFVAQWALPTMAARHAARRASAPEDRELFFKTMRPRLAEVIDYLNIFPLDGLPKHAEPLFQLALGFMEVTMALEVLNARLETAHAANSRHIQFIRELDGR